MNLVTYPVLGNSVDGKIQQGQSRLTLASHAWWLTIETSAGVYSPSALATLDQIITDTRSRGVSVMLGMYGTPLFYGQTANNPVVADTLVRGPWNQLGECSHPTSLVAVTNYATMMINRYNKPGGVWFDANGATLGKGIQIWEGWNEPHMDTLGNRRTAAGQQETSTYYWGTKGQLIDLLKTQHTAVKSADPSVIITSPGLGNQTGPTGHLHELMTTVGTVTGAVGSTTFDAVNYHPYFAGPPATLYGDWGSWYRGDIANGTVGVAVVNNWLKKHGYSHPVYIGEWGIDTAGDTLSMRAWYRESADFRYRWVARVMMACAALGVKGWHPWTWGGTSDVVGNSGNWQGDTLGVQKAYNDFAEKVSGKTIVSATYVEGGEVALVLGDGTTWTV